VPRILRVLLPPLLGLVMALATTEEVVRQVYWRPLVSDPVFSTIVPPGTTVRWRTEGDGTSRWTVNGIRRPSPPSLEKRPYLVLGDSFTEAFMVDDADVFTQRLEGMLAKGPAASPVLNLGRSGASVADYIAFAPRYRARFSPRWTIVQLRDDDLAADAWTPSKPHFIRAANGELRVSLEFAPRSRFSSLLQPLRRYSTLANYGLIRLQEFALASAAEPPLFQAANAPSVATDPLPDATLRYPILAELELLHDSYDGRITFLMLPEFDLAAPSEPTSETERLWLRTCAARQWSCVSLREVYPAFAAHFRSPFGFSNTAWNQGHMNAAGHHAAARLLEAEMLRLAARGLL